MATSDESTRDDTAHRAGAFDIRNFIALLIGIYGVVLVIAGIIGPSASQLKKAGGLNINLLAGIGMVVVAAAFLAWARMRPVVVPEGTEAHTDAGTSGGCSPRPADRADG